MAYLIQKFKGVYRLKAPYDLTTNDFPRKLNGTYEDVDVYISCQFGNRVFHYGRDILQAYIPSLGRGHNIIKAIQEIDPNIIFDIEESDSEVIFKFKYVNSDKIIPLLKPRTSGANISPFSSRNLPKNKDFKIPDDELNLYKEIICNVSKPLLISKFTKEFIKKYLTQHEIDNMKKVRMKPKEYIYLIYKWDKYLNYLQKEIDYDVSKNMQSM